MYVLDREVIVRRLVGMASQIAGYRLFWLQLVHVYDVVSVNLCSRAKRCLRLRFERKTNYHPWAGRMSIEHEEIVVVDFGLDCSLSDILQVMLQPEDRAVKRQRLCQDICKAFRSIQLLPETD